MIVCLKLMFFILFFIWTTINLFYIECIYMYIDLRFTFFIFISTELS